MFGALIPRCDFSELLSDPGIGWMTGDSSIFDFSSLVGDDDEDVNGSE
jgi:hypothetical protein